MGKKSQWGNRLTRVHMESGCYNALCVRVIVAHDMISGRVL